MRKNDSQNLYIKIPKREVAFFCGFFEAFEGMVAIRTPYRLEGKENVLKLMVSPRFKKEAQALLKFLKKTIPLQRIKDEEALKIAET